MQKNIKKNEKNCNLCGDPFTHGGSRGEARKYCTERCKKAKLKNNKSLVVKRCEVSGCTRKARGNAAAYCETHYYRVRRTGSTLRRKAITNMTRDGYVLVWKKDHPLSIASTGGVMQHRMVLFDAIGECPHQCYWCGIQLNDWGKIAVDHKNSVKHDNRIENLLVACITCNILRGSLNGVLARFGFEKTQEACRILIEETDVVRFVPAVTATSQVVVRSRMSSVAASVIEQQDW